MTTALTCGFFHHLIDPKVMNFERLHVFLFNLCSGGTILLYFTEDKPSLSPKATVFLLLSMGFAFCAFMEWYALTLIIPLALAVITETVRVQHFGSCLPKSLFSSKESTSRKFHQAALLCLSLGLLISVPVTLNSVYGQWVTLDKLKLDTFFLGFSFPISLISMSVIFSLMKKECRPLTTVLKEMSFWIVNLGVIIFFLFILANWFLPQVAIATILFFTVSLVLFLYWRQGVRLQQKAFLTSGILFLVITAITGILYILLAFFRYLQSAGSLTPSADACLYCSLRVELKRACCHWPARRFPYSTAFLESDPASLADCSHPLSIGLFFSTYGHCSRSLLWLAALYPAL